MQMYMRLGVERRVKKRKLRSHGKRLPGTERMEKE